MPMVMFLSAYDFKVASPWNLKTDENASLDCLPLSSGACSLVGSTYKTTRHRIPEEHNQHFYRRENL
jgi:hypothetical protein